MRSRLAKFRREFGGETFLSFPGYIALAAIALVSSVTVLTNTNGLAYWLGAFLANALALGICCIWFMTGTHLLFKNRAKDPVGLLDMITFGAILGAIKGSFTGLFLYWMHIENSIQESVFSRVPGATFIGIVGVLGLTYLEHTFQKYRLQRAELIRQLEHQDRATNIQRYRDKSLAELTDFVEHAKAKLTRSPNSEEDFSSTLLQFVEQDLRPLSHKLWSQPALDYPEFTVASISQLAVTRAKPRPAIIAGLYFLGIFLTLVTRLPAEQAFEIGAGETIVVALGTLLLGVLRPTTTIGAWAAYLVGNTVVALAGFNAVEALGIVPAHMTHWPAGLGTVLWLLYLNFLARFFSATVQSTQMINAAFERLIVAENMNLKIASNSALIEQRGVADFLHGRLQNVLLATALRLETTEANSGTLGAAVNEVNSVLDSVVSQYFEQADADLESSLRELEQKWHGYVAVHSSISFGDSQPGNELSKQLINLANEAVTNSVRHGLASTVTVEIRVTGSETASVVITDDGLGPRAKDPGLGTQLFNELAGAGWSLKPVPDGGSRLTLSVRVA